MTKRYEDYSCEEIKAAMLNPTEREKLIRYISNEVYKILYDMLHVAYKAEAENLLQEAFISLVKNIGEGTFQCGENAKTKPLQILKAYWAKIAYNIARNLSRKKESNDIPLESLDKEITDSEEDFVLQKLEKDKYFYIALEKLGENCKTIITATEIEGKSYEEIMEDTEIMTKTGRNTLLSLRDLKRTCMKKFTNFLLDYFDERGNLKD